MPIHLTQSTLIELGLDSILIIGGKDKEGII